MQFSCLNTVYVRLNDKSSCAVAQITRLYRSTLQTDRLDFLYVARNKVDGLVAPLHVVALGVKHDTLDRLLGRESDGLAIRSHRCLEAQLFHLGERDKLERLRPEVNATNVSTED